MNNKEIIIITGVAGSGKTSFSNELKDKLNKNATIIRTDDHRYVSNWVKKSFPDFQDSICNAISNANTDLIILDGAHNDAADCEFSRTRLFQNLLPNIKVMISLHIPLIDQIARFVDRSIGRELGTIPEGSCKETSVGRARGIIKQVQNYDYNIKSLRLLELLFQDNNVIVIKIPDDKTFDETIRYLNEIDF